MKVRKPREYTVWLRLANSGIAVCERWRGDGGFAAFRADVGKCPSAAHRLVLHYRKDGYVPGNCSWMTPAERIHAGRGNVDTAYFDTWSANMAYILGYTWADGSVVRNDRRIADPNRISYGCVEEDREVIDFIKEELRSTAKIGHLANPKGFIRDIPFRTAKPQVRLRIDSIRLVATLVERHGLAERKSYLDLPFPEVPDEWLPHFVRGFLDGDGTVSANAARPSQCHIGFVGTPKWITGLRDRLVRALGLFPSKVHVYAGRLHAGVAWRSRGDGIRLHDFLYPPGDDYFWLKRKRDKWERLLCVGAYSHLTSKWRPRRRQVPVDILPPS